MWERAGSNVAIPVRESGEALGQERERMRRNLSQMRQTAAGGRKIIAETRALIAVADALATTCWLQRTIEVPASAPAARDCPVVKARSGFPAPTMPNGPIAARAAFEREVSGRFGVMPNFFCSASAAPGLIEELWAFARSAYIDNPLPSLFKERLFVHLSRFCEARYCIVRHVGFLIGEGRPAGDPKVRPETIEQVIELLRRPVPDANELAGVFARLESHGELSDIPAPGTRAEYDLFDALTVMFLEPRKWERAGEAVRRAVGDGKFEILTAFLAFVRTAHYWTETHPRLAIEPDMLAVLEKHDRLARLLFDPSEAEPAKAGEVLRQTLAELKDTKASLREGQERLAAIVQSSDDAIISKDLDGIITSWNKGAERLFGYLAEEAIGKPVAILAPPERGAEDYAILESVRRGDRIHNYETVRRRKDGSLIDVSLNVSPVRDARGNVIGASKIARDITERKRERELLRRQADLLDQSHDAIFTWKIGGGIVYWSKGAERLYKYTAKEAIGRSSHELLRTRSPVPMQEIEWQIVREGSWYGELTHTTRDGRTVVVESRHVRVQYSGEPYVLETNRDITERKAQEEYAHLLTREVNHRVKNILNVVSAIAHRTAAKNPQDFVERFSERIQALSANQDLLIRNEWKGVDVKDLVRAQLAHFASLIGLRITVRGPRLRLKPESAQAIGLALHELATNAGKYGALSTNEGRVDIQWQAAANMFTISWAENDGPPVVAPTRRGFGSTVITTMAKYSLGGEVAIYYAPSGLMWQLTCPAANALEPQERERNQDKGRSS
jgi:PAS domain S-box-containing protein